MIVYTIEAAQKADITSDIWVCTDNEEIAEISKASGAKIYRIPDDMARDEMAEILAEVQDGSFAKEWILENQVGRPVYNALKRLESEELIEEVGAELRQMMPWLKGKK